MYAETFLEEFAPLTSGPGGISKLRELILQLALRGQLTQHLEADPKWSVFEVAKVANCFTGNSISAEEKSQNYEGRKDGLTYVATKDVAGWHGSINYETGFRIPVDERRFRLGPRGSVLICAEGGSAGRKIGLLEQDVNFGNKLICCVPKTEIVLQRFLFRIFQSIGFQNAFKEQMTGIIGGISLSRFKELKVRIPELHIQEFIVRQVDSLMSVCDELEAQLSQEAQLGRAVATSAFREMLESKAAGQFLFFNGNTAIAEVLNRRENIQEFRKSILELFYAGAFCTETPKYTKLEELLSFGPRNGFSPKPSDIETTTKTITLSATTKEHFDQNKFKYISEKIGEDSHLWLRENDILVQRANSLEHVGAAAIVHKVDGDFIYPDLIMKMRVSDKVLAEYVLYALQSPTIRRYFQSNASGTSGSMPKINKGVVSSALIPLVSKEAQLSIIGSVSTLLALCDQLDDLMRS
jgi:restriction endonuclease S subunit